MGNLWYEEQDGSDVAVNSTNPLPVGLRDGSGNAVGSFGGALNVHDADVHTQVFNQFLHYDTATTTTPSVAIASGDNQITFTSVVGFAVGNEIKIEDGSLEPTFFTIMAIVGNVVDIDVPVSFAHTTSATITKIYTNFAEPALTTGASRSAPIVFNAHIPSDKIVHVTNMNVSMLDDAAMDDGGFAGIAALANGIVLQAKSKGIVGSYTIWKDNRNIREDIFTAQYVDKQATSEYGFSASYNIKQSIGGIVYLDGSLNDTFNAVIQDNLTAITNVRMKLQGHYEGV